MTLQQPMGNADRVLSYLTMLFNCTSYVVWNGLMSANEELEWIRKEEVVGYFNVYPSIYMKGQRIADYWGEIRPRVLPNRK